MSGPEDGAGFWCEGKLNSKGFRAASALWRPSPVLAIKREKHRKAFRSDCKLQIWHCSIYDRNLQDCLWTNTHCLLRAPSLCSSEPDVETLPSVGSVKQKVTLFFRVLTSCSFGCLLNTRSFHLRAQRLTALWRCCDLCRTQADRLKWHASDTIHKKHTQNHPLAPGWTALGSSWDHSYVPHMWGCVTRPPSAAGLCRPELLWLPAPACCAALQPTASRQRTPAESSQSKIETQSTMGDFCKAFRV